MREHPGNPREIRIGGHRPRAPDHHGIALRSLLTPGSVSTFQIGQVRQVLGTADRALDPLRNDPDLEDQVLGG